jgi:hypothetical protein
MSAKDILKAEKYVVRNVYYSPKYLYRRLRYASSPSEVVALMRKGTSLLMGRY